MCMAYFVSKPYIVLDVEAGELVVPTSGRLWLAHAEHVRSFRLDRLRKVQEVP